MQLGAVFLGNDAINGLAEHFGRGVAEQRFRTVVPALDDARDRHADDRGLR